MTFAAPAYYALPAGLDTCHDLTDLFVQRYGAQAVVLHLLMELEQYAWRCLSKGQMDSDLVKIERLSQRLQEMQALLPPSRSPADDAALDAAIALCHAHGYVVAPPSAVRPLMPPAAQDEEQAAPETIIQRAAAAWMSRHGTALTQDQRLLLQADLAKHGFQPSWHYAPHASQCERLLPEWFAPEEG